MTQEFPNQKAKTYDQTQDDNTLLRNPTNKGNQKKG